MKIDFEAEVKEVKVVHTVSNDKMVTIKLTTDQETAIKMQSAIANAVVRITAEW